MKVLIFSDLHIDKNSREECRSILAEILKIAGKHNVDALWNLGDTFNMYSPASECLDMYALFVFSWGKDILNVVASSHESTELGKSVLNHFEILSKDYYIKHHETELYGYLLGHYMLNESSCGYKVKRSVKELKKYKRVFLGHQHTSQEMGNAIHIGSCRYVSFSEYLDTKRVLILDLETDILEEIILESPIPMSVVGCDKDSINKLWCELKILNPRNKVKVIFNDLESYKNSINSMSGWSNKFVEFKIELNFQIKGTEIKENNDDSFSNDFIKWLDDNNIDKEIKEVLKKEVENVR